MNRYNCLRDKYGYDMPERLALGRLPDDEMRLPDSDVERLRALGSRKHEIANLPQMQANRELWTAANDLKLMRPPVFVDEICWLEFGDEALKLKCEHPFARELEEYLLQELYRYEHGLGDIVVEDFIPNPIVVYDSGFGIDEVVDIAETEFNKDIVSRHFHILIAEMDDIERIKPPEIIIDRERTAQYEEVLNAVFYGVIPVITLGARGQWFTPWDYLIRVMGVSETMINLYEEPEMVAAAVSRYVDMCCLRLNKYRELGIWSSNNGAVRVGSGGYGYTSALEPFEQHVIDCHTKQMWGCGNAQMFAAVSPQMHWDFSLKYELKWLNEFGLNYYGCCEPLSGKMELMDRIPNLRKVSMSPWNDFNAAAERCRGKYVMSCKPNPAVFATDNFDETAARRDIEAIFDATKGCAIELILKDISTVRFEPHRLWRWAEIAREVINERF